MKKTDAVSLKVALKEGDEAEKFTFSLTWTPPRTKLELAAGPLALVNITFSVADADLAVEDFLTGFPVLQNLGVDKETLLQDRRDLFEGASCPFVRAANESKHG